MSCFSLNLFSSFHEVDCGGCVSDVSGKASHPTASWASFFTRI
jgi:hypothetical protein